MGCPLTSTREMGVCRCTFYKNIQEKLKLPTLESKVPSFYKRKIRRHNEPCGCPMAHGGPMVESAQHLMLCTDFKKSLHVERFLLSGYGSLLTRHLGSKNSILVCLFVDGVAPES